jgi:hypothetical protein
MRLSAPPPADFETIARHAGLATPTLMTPTVPERPHLGQTTSLAD